MKVASRGVTGVSLSTHIDAAPHDVWPLIADPTRMGEWSPECRRLEWLGPAEGPALGARFRGHNRNGPWRWSTRCTIVRYEPESEISWDVDFYGLPVSRWTYRVQPEDEAQCRLVEEFADRRGPVMRVIGVIGRGVRDAAVHNRRGMEETLRRIRAAAENATLRG